MAFFSPGGETDSSASGSLQGAYNNGGGAVILTNTGGPIIFTTDSNGDGFTLSAVASTSGSTTNSAGDLNLRGTYWNGSASTNHTFFMRNVVTSTAPAASFRAGFGSTVYWSLTSSSSIMGMNLSLFRALTYADLGSTTVPWGAFYCGNITTQVLGTPAAPVITNVGTTGATTYTYKVVGVIAGGVTAASSAGSTTTGNATLTTGNYNTVTWTALQGANSYQIYRTVGGATQGLVGTITVSSGALALSLNDTGLTGDGSTAPTVNTTGTITPGGQILAPSGTVGLPSVSIGGGTSGWYSSGANVVSLTLASNLVLDCSKTASGSLLQTAPTQWKATAASGIGFVRIDDSSGLLAQYDNTYLQIASVNATFNISGGNVLALDVPTVDNDTSATLNWRKAGVQTPQRVQLLALASITTQKVLVVSG